jgi:hypothetical protein
MDGVHSTLEGGVINVASNSVGDVLLLTANGADDGTRIFGRSLFVATVSLSGLPGQMFTGTALPTSDAFAAFAYQGYVDLTFRPAASDPQSATGDYVKFSAFLAPSDFTVTVAQVPVPSTALLLGLGMTPLLMGAGKIRSRGRL